MVGFHHSQFYMQQTCRLKSAAFSRHLLTHTALFPSRTTNQSGTNSCRDTMVGKGLSQNVLDDLKIKYYMNCMTFFLVSMGVQQFLVLVLPTG